MSESSEYELEEILGKNVEHELAAGWTGQQVQDKIQDYLHGSDIAQEYLPDLQSMQTHLNEYAGMIDQVGEDFGNYASAQLASEYEEMVPEGPVTPQYGLVVAGFLEQEAERLAGLALDAANSTERGKYLPSRIEAIGGDEQGEAQEVKDVLYGEFNWGERDDVSFDDLTSVENVKEVAGKLENQQL